MKRKNTPHYIVELQLKTEIFQEDIINTRMEIGRSIYNALLTIVLSLLKLRRYAATMSCIIMSNIRQRAVTDIVLFMYI